MWVQQLWFSVDFIPPPYALEIPAADGGPAIDRKAEANAMAIIQESLPVCLSDIVKTAEMCN